MTPIGWVRSLSFWLQRSSLIDFIKLSRSHVIFDNSLLLTSIIYISDPTFPLFIVIVSFFHQIALIMIILFKIIWRVGYHNISFSFVMIRFVPSTVISLTHPLLLTIHSLMYAASWPFLCSSLLLSSIPINLFRLFSATYRRYILAKIHSRMLVLYYFSLWVLYFVIVVWLSVLLRIFHRVYLCCLMWQVWLEDFLYFIVFAFG